MLSLEIMKPDGCLLRADIRSVRAVDASGSFGIFPGHEDFCTALAPSVLTYRDDAGAQHYVAVDGGVLLLENGHISIATREAVLSDDMDGVSVAVASLLRARRESEQAATVTFNKLVTELLEQLPHVAVRR
jgi:F-type H+-transporting ATPase subunit epsilon